ncbi:MAG: hypothetical protein HXO39_08425 [Prevotella sp.]|jgi:hypothetical protein|nr:hypothetical protein [Prevotella sp.]
METKRQLVKDVYIKPCAKVFELAEKSFIMAVSPNVRPGGDAGGSITVIEQTVDDEDTDLEG